MTIEEARIIAQGELDAARSMTGSVSHPETEKRSRLAAIILDLCTRVEDLAQYAQETRTPAFRDLPPDQSDDCAAIAQLPVAHRPAKKAKR